MLFVNSFISHSALLASSSHSPKAGGKASTGTGRILDTVPKGLHDHVPCLMGSYDDVTEAEKYIRTIR